MPLQMNLQDLDLQMFLDHLHDGALVVVDGQIQMFNTTFGQLSGFTQAELLGQSTDHLVVFSVPADEPIVKSAQSHKEALVCCKNGNRLPVRLNITSPFAHRPQTAIWLLRNLTPTRKLEKELQKAQQLESIAALSGGIAHDYNNLLTAIMGNISLAQSYIDATHPIHRLLKESMAASLLAKELTQKLITFSQGGAPQKRPVAISPVVRSATEFSLSGSNVLCAFDFSDGLWTAEIDATQIGQAIHSLIINATEAMPESGTILVSTENFQGQPPGASQLPFGRYVKITIADQGCGIAPRHLEKVFDPYYSTKAQGTDKGKGLGLSICHSIISKHRGTIQITSRVGKGTQVAIFLPATDKAVPALEKKGRPEQLSAAPENCRILIMDDESRIRELAGEMLTRLGYQPAFAENGEEALDQYQKNMQQDKKFDAVILDLTVRGGLGGRQTMEKLLLIDPKVKAIVSSGYSTDPVMSDYKRYGFSGVVAKPYRFHELNAVLAQVLSG